MATMHNLPLPPPKSQRNQFFGKPWDILNMKSNVNIEKGTLNMFLIILNKGVGLLECTSLLFC